MELFRHSKVYNIAIFLAIFSAFFFFLALSEGLLRASIAHCHYSQPFLPPVMAACTGQLA